MNGGIGRLSSLQTVLEATGFDELIGGKEVLAQGLQQIAGELLRIGSDAMVAGTRGVDLADAAIDFENYPFLAKFHSDLADILNISLPPEFVAWLRRLLAMPEPPALEELKLALVAHAADEANPVRRAIWKVVLVELVRVSLLLLQRHDGIDRTRVGVEEHDAMIIAETRVSMWLCARPATPDDVRSLDVIVAGAVAMLNAHAEELKRALVAVSSEVLRAHDLRSKLDALLADVDARDALLIRNHYGQDVDEQPLTIERLQKEHPLVLGDAKRNTLDVRLRRLLLSLEQRGTLPERTGVSLVDLMTEIAEGEIR